MIRTTRDITEVMRVRERSAEAADVSGAVSEITAAVRARGDAALLEFTQKFDGVSISSLEVSADERAAAVNAVPADLLKTMERAAANIREFHLPQRREGYELTRGGAVLGSRILPLSRVGVYVPGGTAAYPSSVLMNIIPAKIAGVSEIIMVTPPAKDGGVPAAILAAADIAGADRIFKVGGAQAVAALAYGTQTVPRVDKIVGPGNAYVAEAKRQAYGQVDIDMIAGPSEILVIADDTANPAWVAADMLSQAEHDKNAAALLVTPSEYLAAAVAAETERQLTELPRAGIARASIEQNGLIAIARDMDEAARISDAVAPEHLELCVADPHSLLHKIHNAGSVFMGHYCPEALGDYFAGTNHILPTGGRARFSSPLGVDDFIRRSSYMYYTREALMDVADDTEAFAKSEGLSAHAKSVAVRRQS